MTMLCDFSKWRNVVEDNVVEVNDPSACLLNLALTGDIGEERAANLLNRLGCRLWVLDEAVVIGYWPDLDGPELRAALEFTPGIQVVSLPDATAPEDINVRLVPMHNPGETVSKWLMRTADETRG